MLDEVDYPYYLCNPWSKNLKGEFMNSILIGLNPDKKIDFLIQNTNGDAGKRTVQRLFPHAKDFNWLPASPYVYGQTKGGCIVAGIKTNPLVANLLKDLGLLNESKRLGAGAYLIHTFHRHKVACLLVAGGDLLGFLYAVSDLARNLTAKLPLAGTYVNNAGWLEDAPPCGILYTGGDKLEIPAMSVRSFWDIDTRTRWNPDCRFPVSHCCLLDYPESAEMYIDNMKRVVDGMVDYRRNVLTIWGFVRAEHGGVEAAHEVVRYAREHGVDVAPGIGTHFYGGPFFRGKHPFNLDTYMRAHRERLRGKGKELLRVCPTDPHSIAWLLEGVRWLFETFDIQGASLENGDFYTCKCPRCRKAFKHLQSPNPEFFNAQHLCYGPVLQELERIPQARWKIYATYTGFSPGISHILDPLDTQYSEDAKRREDILMARNPDIRDLAMYAPPAFARAFPKDTIAQWNIDGQLRQFIPLSAFLDDGHPEIVYQGPLWPKSLRSPVPRNIFYALTGNSGGHHLSQLKELYVRTARDRYDGIVDYGERSPRDVATEIKYLAHSHFSYHPFDSLRGFARAQLAHRVGGPERAEQFIECLCRKESGSLTDKDRQLIEGNAWAFQQAMLHNNMLENRPSDYSADRFENWHPYSYWSWLQR
jgi:hypothetical protein